MTSLASRFLTAFALAGGLALVPAAPARAITSGEMYNVLVQAPNFTLPTTTDGEAVSLTDYSGKVRLVVFWASWCPSCRQELPALIRLQEKYQKQGVQVVAIAVDPKEAAARDAYVKKMGFNFPSLAGDAQVKQDYGQVTSIPTTFMIGRKGYIYKHYIGAYPEKTLEADLKKLL
jgi:thiol-disulfide isomerase/thioredoxin